MAGCGAGPILLSYLTLGGASTWLLAEDLLRGDPGYAHCYRLRDDQGRALLDHGGIWLFELNKFTTERVETEQQRWLKFFKDGGRLDETALPEWMQTEIARLKALLPSAAD